MPRTVGPLCDHTSVGMPAFHLTLPFFAFGRHFWNSHCVFNTEVMGITDPRFLPSERASKQTDQSWGWRAWVLALVPFVRGHEPGLPSRPILGSPRVLFWAPLVSHTGSPRVRPGLPSRPILGSPCVPSWAPTGCRILFWSL